MPIRPRDLPPETLAKLLAQSKPAPSAKPAAREKVGLPSPGNLAADAVAGWCRQRGWPEPEREFRFAPPRRWRFDLAWPTLRVAVEFQGGVWSRGRHNRPVGFTADCEKFSTAASMGWRVMSVTYAQYRGGLLRTWLEVVLAGA